MQEEFTTKMHLEFFDDPKEILEIKAGSIYLEVIEHKERTLEEALKDYDITQEEYERHNPFRRRTI